MTTTIIPAGYRLTVVTWENDADNYNTVVKEGLSFAQVSLYVDLCKLAATSHHENKGGIGNLYEPDLNETSYVFDVLSETLVAHNEKYPSENFDDSSSHGMDMLSDLGICDGEFFTRVCESFKVEYLATPVVLNDVTTEFV